MGEAAPAEPVIHWVESSPDVTALAADVVDARRSTPIVCLTTPGYLSRPLVDPEALADALTGIDCEIWVITQRAHAWALTEALPPSLDVYGGAVRIWWPIYSSEDDPRRHPRFTVFSASDVDRVVREIVGELRRHQLPQPAIGDHSTGVVTKVFSSGAEILLDSGYRSFASNAYLADGPIYHAWEAVREGQQVDVEIRSNGPTSHGTIAVSLKPFAPDPWVRLAEVYAVGMVVEGVTVDLKSFGAFIELLPGARGLLPNAHIASEFVAHPEDYLSPDDRVVVRLLTLEPEQRKAELALVDPDDEPEIQPVAALYPDGPSWLAPLDDVLADGAFLDGAIETLPDADAVEPATDDAHTAETSASSEGEVAGAADDEGDFEAIPDAESILPGEDLTEQTTGADEPTTEPSPLPDRELATQLDQLAEAAATTSSLEERVEALVNQGDRELARLRQQAREIVGQLRDDIAAAERRIIELEQQDSAAVIADARRDIESVQQQTDELRERLAAAEQDREQLIRQVTNANRRADRSTREAQAARRDAQEAHTEASTLRGQLEVLDDGDPARRFLRELHYTWSRLYSSDADRRRYPFSEPILGPAFLASLDAVHGITRERVLEVCAHVVSGRAHEINSLELHQLRSSGGGDTPTVVRGDGALAWRVSLQVKTPSARRLHYWQRPDGRIELSKIVLHDDFSIV